MSRPSLGYSNYYWIRQDRKRLEKKQKEKMKEVVKEVEVIEEPPTENIEPTVEVVEEEKQIVTAIARPQSITLFGKPNE